MLNSFSKVAFQLHVNVIFKKVMLTVNCLIGFHKQVESLQHLVGKPHPELN